MTVTNKNFLAYFEELESIFKTVNDIVRNTIPHTLGFRKNLLVKAFKPIRKQAQGLGGSALELKAYIESMKFEEISVSDIQVAVFFETALAAFLVQLKNARDIQNAIYGVAPASATGHKVECQDAIDKLDLAIQRVDAIQKGFEAFLSKENIEEVDEGKNLIFAGTEKWRMVTMLREDRLFLKAMSHIKAAPFVTHSSLNSRFYSPVIQGVVGQSSDEAHCFSKAERSAWFSKYDEAKRKLWPYKPGKHGNPGERRKGEMKGIPVVGFWVNPVLSDEVVRYELGEDSLPKIDMRKVFATLPKAGS
jgi:hypothetical protein